MRKTILIVEDHPAIIELLQKQVEILGYNSLLAEDGKKAVDMAFSHLPDLILMDVVLPKIDGLEAVSLIRKNPKTQSIPVLAVTARALAGDKEKCLKSGCNGYLSKPFTYEQLDEAIKKLLMNHNSDQLSLPEIA